MIFSPVFIRNFYWMKRTVKPFSSVVYIQIFRLMNFIFFKACTIRFILDRFRVSFYNMTLWIKDITLSFQD